MRSIRNPIPFLFSFLLLIFLSCKTLSPVNGEDALPQWEPFAVSGLDYYAGKLSNPRIEFHALRVDLSSPDLRIVVSGGAGGGETLSSTVSSFVRDYELLAGINALPFDPVSGTEGEPRTNVGIVIADGVMISPQHPEFDALVFYRDGSAAIVAQSEIQSIENIENAVGGFYRILQASEPHFGARHHSDARHPRSAAGLSPDGRFLFLLVIDGRRPGSVGSTETETALLLKSLGASEGINFDGGGSAALALRYADGTVRVVNTPIHGGIPGRERAVAGCLGVGIVKDL